MLEWTEAYSSLRESLGIQTDEAVPKLQRPQTKASITIADSTDETSLQKRKHATDEDVEMDTETTEDPSKRPKTDGAKSQSDGKSAASDMAIVHAKAAAAYIPFLSEEMLMPPKMPTHDEMENVLLDLRKRALVEEYFGNEES